MKTTNRYVILVIAAIVNFVHGNPYIWTVFQPYVREEYGLSLAASSQPFTIIIGIFAVGNMLGGFLQHKIGARATILAGSLIMCMGFFSAAMAPVSMPWVISAGYGLLGGLGSGCAFSMLVAVPQSWFPERRGLVTGITMGVVGISGVLMNPLCDYVLEQKGYRFTMLMVTVIYALLCLLAFFIREPEEGSEEVLEDTTGKRQYSTKEMIKTKTFYLISISMALAVPAYVLVNPLMKSLGMERGLGSREALIGVIAASIANIFGRFVAPWISDRVGRKTVIIALYVIAMVSVIGISVANGGLFILLISLVSLTYGGFVSVFPVLTADCYGMKYQGLNLGTVMLGYGIVSVLCPYLLDITEASRFGIELSFVIAGMVCLIGIIVTACIRPERVE